MKPTLYIKSNKYSTQERQTKRGKVYDCIFRVVGADGVERQKKLSGYRTKALLKEAYLTFVTENCKLVKNDPFKKVDGKTELTIERLVPLYFKSQSNQIKNSTIYEKQKLFDLIILPRFANYKLKDLTKQELYQWQDEIWSTKNPKTNDFYSWKYLSKIRAYFSAFLSWCAERYDTTNYLLQIKKPKRRAPKTEMQFWTREEFDKFISVVDNPIYHAFFMTLFFTGRRKGEVLALTKEDVKGDKIIFNKSLTRKTLTDETFQITSTKTEKVGATPICKSLQQELEHFQGGEVFFFGGDKPLVDQTIRRYFNDCCNKAGVKQIRIHDLRHSFVSMLIHLGANLTVVADLIGDTLAQVTKTYAHLYEEDKTKIIEKIK